MNTKIYLKKVVLSLFSIFIISTISCQKQQTLPENPLIFLIGESHGNPEIIAKELELWQHYYQEEGFRHLFIEIGYVQALILNEWMKSNSNDLFAQMFDDLQGTAFYTQDEVNLFKEIKRTCPKTIFHGTDIGHQYESTGSWYLDRMKRKELENTPEYLNVIENNNQAKEYYNTKSEKLRENYMTQNFIKEYDSLPKGTKIMGIYGSAHTGLNKKNITRKVDCMAKQLNKYYKKLFGESIILSQDLSELQASQ